MTNRPEILVFSIGGFHQGHIEISYCHIEDKFFLHKIPKGFDDSEMQGKQKSDSHWDIFWKKVDLMDVWNWDKEYTNDILDGEQWELNIKKKGKRHIRIYGSNSYPGQFKNFLGNLEWISGLKIK